MLILRQADAVEKAVKHRGTCTALFSIGQVIEMLEDSGDCDEAVAVLRDYEESP